MLYFGLLGGLLGCFIGPVWQLTLNEWICGRVIALVLLGISLVLWGKNSRFGAVVLGSGMLIWLGLHHRSLPSNFDQGAKVIFRHGDHFGGVILVTAERAVVSAYGSVQTGDRVRIRCQANRNFFASRACFAHVANRSTHHPDGLLDQRLQQYGQTISRWIRATLLGQTNMVDFQQKKVFKQSGLYHLLVVSGFHVNLISAMVKLILLSIMWLLYCLRLVPPRVWQVYKRLIELFCIIFVWWFAYATGLGCPVQRAALCYSLSWVGFRQKKFLWGLILQSLLFPCGWMSLSNALSWSCYLALASTSGRTWRDFIWQNGCLSGVAWVLIGCFTPIGLLANIFLAPWLAILISLGGFILLMPADCDFVEWYRTAVITTEELLTLLSDYSGYFETGLGWLRWLALAMMLGLFVACFKPCNVEQKLLS